MTKPIQTTHTRPYGTLAELESSSAALADAPLRVATQAAAGLHSRRCRASNRSQSRSGRWDPHFIAADCRQPRSPRDAAKIDGLEAGRQASGWRWEGRFKSVRRWPIPRARSSFTPRRRPARARFPCKLRCASLWLPFSRCPVPVARHHSRRRECTAGGPVGFQLHRRLRHTPACVQCCPFPSSCQGPRDEFYASASRQAAIILARVG